MFKSLFGKYRFLVVSIALFLVFDLGVLVLNFYTSGKIAEQAELINLAGRQRTLTQQMSKATLYIKAQKLQLWVYQSGLDELRGHYTTFAKTLDAFNHGGTIAATGSGLPIKVKAIDSEQGREILAKTNVLWQQFEQALAPLMVDTLITDDEIKPASAFIALNNTTMFAYMDELTEFFKSSAERQATFLRGAQVIGIGLATINFFVILFHFLGQLRRKDHKLQVKQHESDQILSTIGEGVFLLDETLTMSGQHSKQLEEIFGTKQVAGVKLKRFLNKHFPKKTVKTALEFVRLYFRNHIDPNLIDDLNPLKRVEASVSNSSGETEQKYLDFSFARLGQGLDKPSILVTVKDVTAKIQLEAQDQQATDNLNQQMSLLTQILPIPRHELDHFISDSATGYDRINLLLKETKHVTDNFAETLVRIAREAHRLKGNAAALNLKWIVEQLHEFEDNIEALKERSRVKKFSGRDLLPLAIKLKSSYDSLELIAQLRDRLGSYSSVIDAANDGPSSHSEQSAHSEIIDEKWRSLQAYASKLAADHEVSLTLELRGFDKPVSAALTDKLYPLAIQLLHNAVAHGIESESVRERLTKPNQGKVSLALSNDLKGNVRFVFQDDGRGFNYEDLRKELVLNNVLSSEQARSVSNQVLVQYAFKDAVSTKSKATSVAGRGVGLALVWQQISAIQGKLKIRSVAQEFTQFIIDLHHESAQEQALDLFTVDKAS